MELKPHFLSLGFPGPILQNEWRNSLKPKFDKRTGFATQWSAAGYIASSEPGSGKRGQQQLIVIQEISKKMIHIGYQFIKLGELDFFDTFWNHLWHFIWPSVCCATSQHFSQFATTPHIRPKTPGGFVDRNGGKVRRFTFVRVLRRFYDLRGMDVFKGRKGCRNMSGWYET